MISEGLCNTEDWSNDAENSALTTGINYILQYIQIENVFEVVIFKNQNQNELYWPGMFTHMRNLL